jgi:cystathionine beta-lyase/cystathionine gamma-synthase
MRFATRALRVAQDLEGPFRPVIPPIYQTATFGWDSLSEIPKVDYTRCNNPNRSVLEQVVAALENAKWATAFGSGMAAVNAVFGLLKSGDHLLVASDIYGGTQRLKDTILPNLGVQTGEFNALDLNTLESAIRPETKMLIFETPTNPNLRISDIAAIAKLAREKGVISVIDNTFASPVLQNPLDQGVDIVLHSTTKYITGHSDVVGGVVATNQDELHASLLAYLKATGAVPSPFDCWLTLRGLKTLEVRMKQHCKNANAVAEFLNQHAKVEKVHFPGLASHPGHELAKRQMHDFGGMVSFEVKGTEAQARKVAESTCLFLLAESLGGVESLMGYPKLMSHGDMTEEQRLAKGIPPTLLRLSVGIEDKDDLIEDLDQALAKV